MRADYSPGLLASNPCGLSHRPPKPWQGRESGMVEHARTARIQPRHGPNACRLMPRPHSNAERLHGPHHLPHQILLSLTPPTPAQLLEHVRPCSPRALLEPGFTNPPSKATSVAISLSQRNSVAHGTSVAIAVGRDRMTTPACPADSTLPNARPTTPNRIMNNARTRRLFSVARSWSEAPLGAADGD